MRIDHLEVVNYKGISKIVLDDLKDEPLVMISGRNGTGKSLLLEAIAGAWSGRYALGSRGGPWGDEVVVDLQVHFTDEELEKINDWHHQAHGDDTPRKDSYQFKHVATRLNSVGQQVSDSVVSIARNDAFQREHPFSVIDFLPASRNVLAAPSPTIDLAMLNIERVEQERLQMMDQFINSRAAISLPNIGNYLATLDYQAHLAQRQNLEVPNEYARLKNAFYDATGKTLLEPQYDPSVGSSIEVMLPTTQRHGLSDLSGGEQEMLALMYFVRRLSATGGILCLDEPEQHLHPTLQGALFRAMRDLAARAQVITVSHSVNLIATAPPSALVQVGPPSHGGASQGVRLKDEPDRAELINDLGIAPADLLQSDMLLVVEGETDQRLIQDIFPVEFGRAHAIIAGNAHQVTSAYDTLEQANVGLPWLCVRDRDLMSDAERQELLESKPSLYIWPQRAIESNLLYPPLLARVLTSTGRSTSTEAAERILYEEAGRLKDRVLFELVKVELSRRLPAPRIQGGLERYAGLKAYFRGFADVNTARADPMNEVLEEQRSALESRWQEDWFELVDPKIMLERTLARVGVFGRSSDLKNALIACIRDFPEVRPPALEEFRGRMAQALRSGLRESM